MFQKIRERVTYQIHSFKNFVIFCSRFSLVTNTLATQSLLLQNTATNSKFSDVFSIYRPVSCHYSVIFFFFDYLTKILYIHQNQIDTINKALQRGRKEGRTVKNKLRQTVSTEIPFETLGRHVDPAHSDETSHEKPVLPKRTQNLDPLPRIASVD